MYDIVSSEEKAKVEVQQSDEQYQLVLPCDVKDFRQFVSGLLGKPQEEKGKVEGAFHAEPKDVSNIYHLINQRVTQQNDGTLIHFSITVLYDNGTSVSHNDVRHFEDYYPTSDTHPTEIVLSFTYLITFKTKNAPEKQEVEVVISTDSDRLRQRRAWLSGGIFEYRIKHTDRTWSSDIANVLKNHASTFVSKHNWFLKFMTRFEDDIFEYAFWLILLGFCSYWYFSTKSIFFGENRQEVDISLFIEHALNFSYIFIALIAFTKFIEKVATYRFFIRKMSYITLIDKDYKKMKESKSKLSWKMIGYAGSLAMNIGAGMLASYIYSVTIS